MDPREQAEGLRFPGPALAAALCLLAACSGARSPDEAAARNVLLITIDTLRADHVGAIGYERDTTPHIDALAGRATVFTQAIAQSPWTRSSMASVMTGLYPTTVGVTCHNFRVPKAECDLLPRAADTLAEAAAAGGLRTGAVVANINVDPVFGFDQGFDRFVVVSSKHAKNDPDWRMHEAMMSDTTREVSEAGLAFLDERASDGEPFLLYLHYLDPHHPYEPPAEHARSFAAADYDLHPESRADAALYDGEIRFVDEDLSRIFARLEEGGLDESTLIVILSDHGEEFREHGGTHHGWNVYDHQIRVPLIVALPGDEPARTVDQQVRLVDVMPTVLEALGLDGTLTQGVSLLPLVRGRSSPERPALSEHGYNPLVAWRSPPWKLIHNTEHETNQLFDLENDPGEQTDVAAKHPDVTARLYGELLEARERLRRAAARIERAEGDVPLTEEQIRRLESIGYVDDE